MRALIAVASLLLATSAVAQNVEIKPGAKPKRDKYLITAEEIAGRPEVTNAYEAVKLLRPEYLKTTRARGSMNQGDNAGYRPDVVGRPVREQEAQAAADAEKKRIAEPRAGSDARAGDDQGQGGLYGNAQGGGAGTTAVLYVDEVRQPNLDELKNIRAAEVLEIRYMTGTQAAGRYGAGHEGGAILLKTNRMGKP